MHHDTFQCEQRTFAVPFCIFSFIVALFSLLSRLFSRVGLCLEPLLEFAARQPRVIFQLISLAEFHIVKSPFSAPCSTSDHVSHQVAPSDQERATYHPLQLLTLTAISPPNHVSPRRASSLQTSQHWISIGAALPVLFLIQ